MNKSAFLQLIQQTAAISDQQTEELEKVAATFPYCQTAHLLLAKSAYDKGSMLSTQRLRRASAYATNRQLLKRIIYTSPVAEPVFDESAVEEQATVAQQPQEQQEFVQPIEQPDFTVNNIEEEEVVVESEEGLPSVSDKEFSFLVEESELEDQDESVETFVDTVHDEEPTARSLYAVDHEDLTEPEQQLQQLETQLPPIGNILEQPMEKLDSELALLLTIKSLSPSFTDLLAQKPDVESSVEQPKSVAEAPRAEQVDAPAPTEEELAVAHAFTLAAEPEQTSSYFGEDSDVQDQPQAVPFEEEAEVKYAFDEIEEMYQQDVLGYWMASSRMGEVLQPKESEEPTRARPVGFHPELILEYSKTHELLKQEQPSAPSLHAQIDLIDHFLKLNPRLKAMQNVKMKPEPQEDLSLKSTKIKRGIASESLANIFVQQGKAKKAIKIYEQLILKYPEKKSYFAEEIEKLQNLS